MGLLFFGLVVTGLLISPKSTAIFHENTDHGKNVKIGCIVDTSSRVGKEEGIAVEMAVEDFHNYFNKSLNLIIKDFQSQPLQAALMAMDLIQVGGVQAILGPNTWEAAALAAQIGNDTQTPILYFGYAIPKWAIELWPFLIQASSNHYIQMKAIAAIVQSWKWHQVTILYEDSDSYANEVFPYLSDALYSIDVVVAELVALPPVSSLLFEVLMRLKEGQCRVFILHSSLELALKIFETAKKMEMMEKNYVWITTDATTSMVHSIDPVSLSFMQGVLGVKGHFSESGENIKFSKMFSERFQAKYPHEENHEPGIFAVQAYNAVWAVGLAVGSSRSSTNIRGQTLLDKILQSNFSGLTKVQFIDQKLPPMQVFQIINIVGRRSYREIGFWLEYAGFLETLKGGGKNYSSMENLEPVIWPRGPKITPKGWTFSSSSSSTLRIGVPTTRFKQFVRAEDNNPVQKNNFTGFSIDVFKAAIEYLPYPLQYEFYNFSSSSSYDDLVKKIYSKEYDAVVGDVGIISKRFQWAEFSHPYTEPGLLMVSLARPQTSNEAWLFVRPFSVSMWALTGVINVFNGFVVWIIERNHCSELRGPFLNQVGTLLWLAFNTLFSVHGEKMHSNLSRMAMGVWLFVALVITQSYLANLTSMLTLQKFEATVKDVEVLKNSKAIIGCGKSSYVHDYLVNVLGFDGNCVKKYVTPEEYDEGFRNKSIVAAFIEAPLAKVFLAKYCKSYTQSGPSYTVGGFGFAFPKGSRLAPDMTKAMLKVAEQGKLAELENSMIASETCIEVDSVNDRSSLSPNSFWGLFTITGGCSTIVLISYIICHEGKLSELMLECKTTWRHFLAVFKRMHQKREHLPEKQNDIEIGPSGFAAVQSPAGH